jgi:hypothetical protein
MPAIGWCKQGAGAAALPTACCALLGRWTDGVSPTPSNTTYRNWGVYNGIFNSQPGLNITEPNNYDYVPE